MVCHSTQHTAWDDSLHRKMMQRVDQPGAVQADFNAASAQLKFDASDAVWVVGNRWEQQFMGHEGGKETLLPGAWRMGLKAWALQGWDGWQVPEPLRRCHGCHTVGLDVKTGTFVEPGIGCESCHGPGGWHGESEGRYPMHAGVDSETCGQCHSRGRSADGDFFYPVAYVPGSPLDSKFTPIKPDFIQNSAQWWGNGRERDRHQQYIAWQRGGHVNALRRLTDGYDGRYGPVEPECLGCHAGEAAIRGPAHGLTLADVKEGVTCSVCHNVHGDLPQLRMACTDCHDQGAFHHQRLTLAEHIPCPPSAKVECADCHMPVTIQIAGEFRLHSHAPGITTPMEGAAFGGPSSCVNAGCHAQDAPEVLQARFDAFYGPTRTAIHASKTPISRPVSTDRRRQSRTEEATL